MLNAWRSALSGLPRESRDTLFLLAVIGWIALLQTPHLPLWCALFTGALLLGRAWLTVTQRPLPGRLWRIALLLGTLGATYLSHRTLLGRDAGVTLIVVLLALKTLELRARRDAFVVFFLGFFTLLTHFFYSQSLATAAGILLALLGLLAALVNAHMPVGRPGLWKTAGWAGGMALLGAPIMLVLFLLFPRMAPLWGIPSDGMTGRSGLSSSMQVGTIAELALNDAIAFRLRFEGRPPPQSQMYFRGPVLSRLEGREWRALRPELASLFGGGQARLEVQGEPVRYQVTMEPSSRPWLFVLEATAEAPVVAGHEVFMGDDLQWRTRRPVTDLLRYQATSHPSFLHGPRQATLELQPYLELPPGYNPRTLALAQTLRREMGNPAPRVLVDAVLQRLRTGGYSYTLEPGVYGEHTADEFWFDRRAGFCEHIASSFAILMRALDIPTRVVTGYQGGETNPVDGYWTVRHSDAHAWTEVWLTGEGWVRVDPTTAVAPGRTGSFQRLRAPQGVVGEALLAFNPTLAAQMRAFWEAMNNRWNQWVLNYTQSRQLDLLKRLGFESPDWSDLVYTLIAVVVLASLGGAGWTLWERRRHDPWLRLLERARRRLRRAGLDLPPHPTPRQMAQALEPGRHDEAVGWLLRLERQRYAVDSGLALATLATEFRHLTWPAPVRPAWFPTLSS